MLFFDYYPEHGLAISSNKQGNFPESAGRHHIEDIILNILKAVTGRTIERSIHGIRTEKFARAFNRSIVCWT
jgi:hypothetical protein